MFLIIGATGELGSTIVRLARESGIRVRALARPGSDVADLVDQGVEVWSGDLTQPDSLNGLCEDVDVVIATASTIVPRRGERTTSSALNLGYLRLAQEAEEAGVRRFVFVSVPCELIGRGAAEFDAKAVVEGYLSGRRFELCVIRPSLFMECWLPAIGSRLAVHDDHRATLNRGFWLSRFAGAVLHRTVDAIGVAQHPGLRTVRHSFVAIPDVAEVAVRVARSAEPMPHSLPVGGPRALTWSEVVAAHAAALNRRIWVVRVLSFPFRVLAAVMRLVSPAAANLLAVQGLVGQQSTEIDPRAGEVLLGRQLKSVNDHLAASAGVHVGEK